jgi:hypothetical protein
VVGSAAAGGASVGTSDPDYVANVGKGGNGGTGGTSGQDGNAGLVVVAG